MFVVPVSDTTLDDSAFETIRLLGELYGLEARAEELTGYLRGVEEDLAARTADIPEADKPSVYVCGVSFQGAHGFEGTEAHYGPFELIGANNLADQTASRWRSTSTRSRCSRGTRTSFSFDLNGLDLIREDYAAIRTSTRR